MWCAERQASLRNTLSAGIGNRQCDAEVRNERLAIVQQDVLGFEIAMDHAVAVCVIEGAGNRHGDAHRLVHRKLFFAIDAMPQRFALDERHDVEQQPIGFARIEQRKQIGVLQIRGDADLAEEAFDAEDGAELGAQDLERDVAGVLDVASEIDRGHAAAADFPLYGVAVGEGGTELGDVVH